MRERQVYINSTVSVSRGENWGDGGAGAAGPGGGSAEADATDRMADARGSVGDGLHGI